MTDCITSSSTRGRRGASELLCLLLIIALLTVMAGSACASAVEGSLTVSIQSTKTTILYPLDPKERDIVSVYGLIYESLIVIDDSYLPSAGIAESW